MRRIALILLVLASQAQAFETRFGIDPSLNLEQLEKTGTIAIRVDKVKGAYNSDASAVIRVDQAKLFAASMDYDHYKEMGMPNVQGSHIVERPSADQIITWTQMSTAGVLAQHYLDVRVERKLNAPGSEGLQWQLTPRQSKWQYAENGTFARLDGSWYIQPLNNGALYIRYFLAADVNTSLPGFIVDGIIKKQFRDGIQSIIQTLAREAANRP